MILLLIVLVPIAITLFDTAFLPARQLRVAAVFGSVMVLALSLSTLNLTGVGGLTSSFSVDWARSIGLTLRLSTDGVTGPLLALNALISTLALLATKVEELERPRLFITLLLLTESAAAGVLLARDLVLFFVFWELVMIPVVLMIALFGEGRRQYSAIKLLIFTSAGSLAMLLAILGAYAFAQTPTATFGIDELRQAAFNPHSVLLTWTVADLVFVGFALAFAVKSPIVPLHGWLAAAYVSAPTPVVMVLAGVIAKLGPYGFYRIGIGILPGAFHHFSGVLMALSAAGILYGALMALCQDDLKRAITYVSLSHMGFISLGMVGLTPVGVTGAGLQMVNHGLLIAGLFFVVDHLERKLGTRSLAEIGGGLARRAPRLTALFLIIALGTLGLPGLNGFVGEYLIMLGTYAQSRSLLIVAAIGVVLAAWYGLRIYQGVVAARVPVGEAVDLLPTGMTVMTTLAVLVVVIGVFPAPLLDGIGQSVNALLLFPR